MVHVVDAVVMSVEAVEWCHLWLCILAYLIIKINPFIKKKKSDITRHDGCVLSFYGLQLTSEALLLYKGSVSAGPLYLHSALSCRGARCWYGVHGHHCQRESHKRTYMHTRDSICRPLTKGKHMHVRMYAHAHTWSLKQSRLIKLAWFTLLSAGRHRLNMNHFAQAKGEKKYLSRTSKSYLNTVFG